MKPLRSGDESRSGGMPAEDDFAYDRVLKDVFQLDHPSVLMQMTGGVPVREFLNVEFQKVMERRADLVALLDDDSISHFEIQSQNDKQIPYRMGICGLLISQKYQRPVRQVVLYVGEPKMRMRSELNTGCAKISFRLMDIRELDAGKLLQSGSAGDLVLAMLAKGGTERLGEIARRAAGLGDRVLTQLILLSGLRKLSRRLRMELTTMGSFQTIIRKNEILRDVWEEVMAEGLAKGKAEGKAEGEAKGEAKGELIGMRTALHGFLHNKFGHVPKWAEQRLSKANRAQVERWLNKVFVAQGLEGVIGKK